MALTKTCPAAKIQTNMYEQEPVYNLSLFYLFFVFAYCCKSTFFEVTLKFSLTKFSEWFNV